MDVIKSTISKFDYQSNTGKLVISFFVTALLFSLFAPGVFFEVNPVENPKFSQEKKVSYKISLTHGVIFSLIYCLFIYFYLLKTEQKVE